MTKLEAIVTQLVNKAASGDLKATRVFMHMAAKFPELVQDPPEWDYLCDQVWKTETGED